MLTTGPAMPYCLTRTRFEPLSDLTPREPLNLPPLAAAPPNLFQQVSSLNTSLGQRTDGETGSQRANDGPTVPGGEAMGSDTCPSPTVPARETPPCHTEEQMAHQPGVPVTRRSKWPISQGAGETGLASVSSVC